MQSARETGVTISLSVVGVALLAELISQKADGVGVIQSIGSAFSNSLGEAIAPVTGSGASLSGAYPGGGGSRSGFGGSSVAGGSGLGSFGATVLTASGASPLNNSYSNVLNSVAVFFGGGATGSYITSRAAGSRQRIAAIRAGFWATSLVDKV
jgi:hypothetical protein